MPSAQHRLEPAGQRRIGQQAVEIDRCLRHRDRMTAVRNATVQIGQRLDRAERTHLGHERSEQVERAICLGDEVRQGARSEEHTSELQSLMRISYAVFCLKKKKQKKKIDN